MFSRSRPRPPPARGPAMFASSAVGDRRADRPDRRRREVQWRAWEDRQDAELYRVAAYTGMRLGELLALRWEDVDLERRRVIVHRAVSAVWRVRPRAARQGPWRWPTWRRMRSRAWPIGATTPAAM